jgi:hypothetical protein
MSFNDIWRIIDDLLDQARPNHARRYSDSRHPHCLLCSPRSLSVRHQHVGSKSSRSSSTAAGFVDLSYPVGSTPHRPQGGASSASGSDTPPTGASTLLMNGHASTVDATSAPMTSSSSASASGRFRFPHVVGYYETDSRKPFPKDSKKSNLSVDQLKSAIVRLTAPTTSLSPHGGATVGGVDGGVPASWMAFVRHVGAIKEQAPNVPCIGFDEVTCRLLQVVHSVRCAP